MILRLKSLNNKTKIGVLFRNIFLTINSLNCLILTKYKDIKLKLKI